MNGCLLSRENLSIYLMLPPSGKKINICTKYIWKKGIWIVTFWKPTLDHFYKISNKNIPLFHIKLSDLGLTEKDEVDNIFHRYLTRVTPTASEGGLWIVIRGHHWAWVGGSLMRSTIFHPSLMITCQSLKRRSCYSSWVRAPRTASKRQPRQSQQRQLFPCTRVYFLFLYTFMQYFSSSTLIF